MPAGPFDADFSPGARRDLGDRLRALLEVAPLDVRGMAAGLGVEPEVVVVALREVRADPAGRLRSAIHLGRTTWQWEPVGGLAAARPVPSLTSQVPSPTSEDEATLSVDAPHAQLEEAGAQRKKGKGKRRKS